MSDGPHTNARIDLRHCTDLQLVRDLIENGELFDMITLDPPWLYRGGRNNTRRGLAGFHYDGMRETQIAATMALSALVAQPNSYCVVWCTFPKLAEWLRLDETVLAAGWSYVTGGVWGKLGNLGVGYHLRGDAELILVYKFGKPQAQVNNQSDLWLLDVPPSLLWTAQRSEHSQKPLTVLRDLVEVFCPAGGRVLNFYSGNAATMERACRDTGRSCTSCEASLERWTEAMQILNTPELFPPEQWENGNLREQLEQMVLDLGELTPNPDMPPAEDAESIIASVLKELTHEPKRKPARIRRQRRSEPDRDASATTPVAAFVELRPGDPGGAHPDGEHSALESEHEQNSS